MVPKFLTESYPLEKHLFLVPRFALRIIGFYPETNPKFWNKIWAFLNFSILVFGCYAELRYGIEKLPLDVADAFDAFCPVASSIMSNIKVFFIWWYKDDFKNLIERIRNLTLKEDSKEKIDVKKKYFTLTTRLTALVMWFAFSTSNAFFVRPIIVNIIRYYTGNEILYQTPFKMTFPDSWLRMPIYPITFLMVHWHGYITLCCFVGADGFFLAFCSYFTTLLKSLEIDLHHVLSKPDFTVPQKRENQLIIHELTEIVEKHNNIVMLIEQFSSIMVVITLAHFVTSSLIIGTSIIDLIVFSGYGRIVYVVYTCAVITEIFLYCLGGHFLIDSSSQLGVTAYCSNWYLHSLKIQKMVLLIIVRCQRAIVVQVPFFAPALPALTSIFRFTGSLIALAQSVL